MTDLPQYVTGPARAAQFCQLWSDHVDALERHLSAKMWALAAASVVLITYPIAQMVIPAVLHAAVIHVVVTHAAVSNVVRTVLSSIGV
jgi:hypothetical protein